MRGRKGFVKTVERSGRTGFYLRVITEGEVAAGDPITLVTVDHAAVSIAAANAIHRHRHSDADGVRRLLAVPALAHAWREELAKALVPRK